MSTAWECETCGFRLFLPIDAPRLRRSVLGLYDDGRFPGRCLLVYKEHAEHLDALPPEEVAALWADAADVGAAVRRLTSSARVNYAVLGNANPHLHVHIIPRQPGAEDLPTRPPWLDPRPLVPLSQSDTVRLTSALAFALH